MAKDPIVFAMANPTPEIMPEIAAPYVRVMATGPLGLPEPDQQRAGVPGHLPRRARLPRDADQRGDEGGRRRRPSPTASPTTSCNEDYIIPSVFNRQVAPAVAAAVVRVAAAEGLARRELPAEGVGPHGA